MLVSILKFEELMCLDSLAHPAADFFHATDMFRSKTAIITMTAIKNRKQRIKYKSGMRRPSLTLIPIQNFDPMSLKEGYKPANVLAKSRKDSGTDKFFSSTAEASDSAPIIPLNDSHGFQVCLESFEDIFLQVNLAVGKIGMPRENRRIPHSLFVTMVDIEGTPDLYIRPEKQADEFGLQPEEKKVWHSKREVIIHPVDANYVHGIYFVKIVSGIDKCKCRVVAETQLYTPTIDNARLGPGHGFRPNNAQKRNGFGNLVISAALGTANRRRLLGKMGRNPFEGREFSISDMIKVPSRPSDTQTDESDVKSRTQSRLSNVETASEGNGCQACKEGGGSALNHALEVSCRSSLERVRFGKITRIRDVTVRDFFSVLNPNRAKETSHVLPAFRESEEVKEEKKPVSPGVSKRLSVPLSSPKTVTEPHLAARQRRGSSEPAGSSGPGPGAKRAHNFGSVLMELLLSADVYRNPNDRFRKPLTECLTVYVPVALVPGFAVLSGDGLGRRKVVAAAADDLKERVRSGEGVSLEVGALVPQECDAVVAFGTCRMLAKDAFAPTLPVSKGMNVEFECSAFFEQFGAFVPAAEYIRANFPGALHDYEKLRRRFTRPAGARFESLPIEISVPQRRRAEIAQPREVTGLVVAAVDGSPWGVLQALHGEERSKVAYAARVHAVAQGTVMAREGEWIKLVGQPTRSLLMLLKGAVAECPPAADGADGAAGPARREVHCERGYVIGAEQMFTDAAWRGDVLAETACTLAEISTASLCPIIMNRPEILDAFEPASADPGGGGGGGASESERHDELVGRSGVVAHGLTRSACRLESLAAHMAAVQRAREARLQRFMGFLQHDPLRVITARRWWEEEKWNDRLISMGALQEEEISTIYARRQAYGDAPAG